MQAGVVLERLNQPGLIDHHERIFLRLGQQGFEIRFCLLVGGGGDVDREVFVFQKNRECERAVGIFLLEQHIVDIFAERLEVSLRVYRFHGFDHAVVEPGFENADLFDEVRETGSEPQGAGFDIIAG